MYKNSVERLLFGLYLLIDGPHIQKIVLCVKGKLAGDEAYHTSLVEGSGNLKTLPTGRPIYQFILPATSTKEKDSTRYNFIFLTSSQKLVPAKPACPRISLSGALDSDRGAGIRLQSNSFNDMRYTHHAIRNTSIQHPASAFRPLSSVVRPPSFVFFASNKSVSNRNPSLAGVLRNQQAISRWPSG